MQNYKTWERIDQIAMLLIMCAPLSSIRFGMQDAPVAIKKGKAPAAVPTWARGICAAPSSPVYPAAVYAQVDTDCYEPASGLWVHPAQSEACLSLCTVGKAQNQRDPAWLPTSCEAVVLAARSSGPIQQVSFAPLEGLQGLGRASGSARHVDESGKTVFEAQGLAFSRLGALSQASGCFTSIWQRVPLASSTKSGNAHPR